ncbi:MAG: helix-turn-helix domain-containing protein [Acidobacteria bacterium]|nr:helix-turn-helix domain-containing protein [Acidobacteriota bacterium]
MAPSTSSVSSIDDLPPVLSIRDVARFCSVSEFLIRELVSTGKLGHVRLGRLIRIPRASLAVLLSGEDSSTNES